MEKNVRFELFDSNIICDLFGDEVVLVNLDSGVYYSLRSSACEMWIRVQNHYTIIEIITDLVSIYDTNPEELTDPTALFIQELLEKKLIKSTDFKEKQELSFELKNPKSTFSPPILEVFSDMQEILLLDPVHDVDKSGWPVTKKHNDTN